jgi:hypothetical protein
MDHEHKEIDARARAEVAMGRDGRHDRSAFVVTRTRKSNG